MKITSKIVSILTSAKTKKFIIVAVLILSGLYVWEYYCVTRPIEQCRGLCKDKRYFIAYVKDQTLYGHMCDPWYRSFWD
jgi:hypothetical protein